jgi:MFS family permease
VYALVVLFAINLMNFFDRQIIGGVGEGIRREWALSDTALGLLGTVFTLLYAVVGLPLGRLSDKKERRKILAVGVFLWSVLTAVSGVARSFAQLIVARLGVGVGEATCSPASTSLIGDYFPTTQRARAIAIWMLGLPLGLGLANGAEAGSCRTGAGATPFTSPPSPAFSARWPRSRCASPNGAWSKRTPSARAAAPATRTCWCCRFRPCCG